MEFLTKEFIYQKSPQELTSLLYEVCIDNLEQAIDGIEKKQWIDANKKLQKVNDILTRLGVGLNYEAGIIAEQLDVLYNYMADKVIEGNIKKDTASLKEVAAMLKDIASAWNEAVKAKQKQTAPSYTQKRNAYEKQVLAYE